jgi:hypothetical protein
VQTRWRATGPKADVNLVGPVKMVAPRSASFECSGDSAAAQLAQAGILVPMEAQSTAVYAPSSLRVRPNRQDALRQPRLDTPRAWIEVTCDGSFAVVPPRAR